MDFSGSIKERELGQIGFFMKLKLVDHRIRGYDQQKCSSQKNVGPEICGSSGQDPQLLYLWVGRVSNKEDICWWHLVSDVSRAIRSARERAPTAEAAGKALTLKLRVRELVYPDEATLKKTTQDT